MGSDKQRVSTQGAKATPVAILVSFNCQSSQLRRESQLKNWTDLIGL